MTATPTHGGARKGAGRKPKPDSQRLKNRTIRLTDAQWAQFHALGGNTWLIGVLDRASVATILSY